MEIVILCNEDWEELYIDGIKKYGNHRITR